MNPVLNISSGPHVRDRWTTRFIMHIVALALLPTAVVGVIVHGLNALWIILISVVSAVGTEFIFDKLMKKPDTWLDGSAMVTGLMLALTLSPNTPLYLPAIGSVFAILVVKCLFGGLGKNFINPALAARCFLLISFSNSMTKYAVDSISGATPVAVLKEGGSVDVLSMFFGTAPGVIGGCILAIALGGLFLWALGVIHGQIWISVLVGFTVFLGLFGGHGFDPSFLAAHLCGGGVVLGAFFMATDYVTSPVSRLGQTVYGLFIGILGAMFRVFGTAADSFSYSIIIANLMTPLIDRYVISKPYAFRKFALKIQNFGAKAAEEQKTAPVKAAESVPADTAKAEPGNEPVRAAQEKKPFFKTYLRPIIVLTVIALAAGAALSSVFILTKDPIAEQRTERKIRAYREVIDGAETFTIHEVANAGQVYGEEFGRTFVNEAVTGLDAAGNVAGYAVSVTSAEGYSGNVSLAVGFDASGTLTSVSFTELKETPGKGMLCNEPEFKEQFNGKHVDAFVLLKNGGASAPEEIDGVTGATVSSKAVTNAVNAAVDYYRNVMGGGKDE